MAVRARHVAVELAVRRRLEQAGQRVIPPRSRTETLQGHVKTLRSHIEPPRGHIDSPRVHIEPRRNRLQPSRKPARRLSDLRDGLEQRLLHISAILLFVGSVGWCWLVFSEFRTPILVSPAEATYSSASGGKTNYEVGKLDPFSSSTYSRGNDPRATGSLGANLGGESPASIVVHEWSRLQPHVAERVRAPAKQALAAKEPKPTSAEPVEPAELETAQPADTVEPVEPVELETTGSPRLTRRRAAACGRNSVAHAVQRWCGNGSR